MLDYIMAELYKLTHRKDYALGFLGVMFAGIALLFFLLKEMSGDTQNTFDAVTSVLSMFLSMGLYLVAAICDIVFSDQYKYNTLKNEVSYGLPRWRVYLGKLTAAVITAFVSCAIILSFYLVVGRILFPVETPVPELLNELGRALVTALPLWLGGLGFFLMLQFLVKGSTSATVIYFLVLAVLPEALNIMQVFVPKLSKLCQGIQAWLLSSGFHADIPHAWLMGAVWFLASTALGLLVFQKREIA